MDNQNTRQQFRFLDDAPVTEDKLGSHKRVAASIATQVEAGIPGMTIGLEGTWGSGKSSVIRMLEERWKDNDDIEVFTFDAWAHQGDPLRRTFLEKMIGFLTERKWLKVGEWKKELDKLARLYEKQDITSTPHIKPLGLILALLLLLYPLGQELFDAGRNAPFYRNFGFWLLAVPFLIVAALYLSSGVWRSIMWSTHGILNRCGRKRGGKWLRRVTQWCGRRAKSARGHNVLAAFLGKSSTSSSKETYRDPQPTSIEFSGVFTRIVRAALPAGKRRLVIVVDNLDRVSTEDALEIWATMKTFVESSRALQSEGLWLIVPYDPEGIVKLWRSDGQGDGIVRAFKEKTFQARYRVAPPLDSRWKDFFKECFDTAFRDVAADDKEAAYEVFRIQALPGCKNASPTPREVKLFINRLVALSEQHLDISLPAVALYAALEWSGAEILQNLAEGRLETEMYLSDHLEEDWREALAAIHFGVRREQAAEVMYTPRIRSILSEPNAEAMCALLAEPRAVHACVCYLRDNAPNLGFNETLAASRAFGKFTPQTGPSDLAGAIRLLADRLASSDRANWCIGGNLTGDRAADVVRLLQFKVEIWSKIADCLCIRASDPVVEAKAFEAALPAWTAGACVIVAELAKVTGFGGITVQMTEPANYLALVDLLANDTNGQKVIKFFVPVQDVQEACLEVISQPIQGGAFRKEDTRILNGVLQMPCWDQNDIAKRISTTVLQCLAREDVNEDVLRRAVRFLVERAATEPAGTFAEVLRKYAGSPHLCAALHQHQGHPEAVALCLGLLLVHNPQSKHPEGSAPGKGQKFYESFLQTPDQNLVRRVAELCIEFGWFDDIAGSIQDGTLDRSDGIAGILRSLVELDVECAWLTSERFLSHHGWIAPLLDKEAEGDKENYYKILVTRLLQEAGDSLLERLQEHKIEIGLGHAYCIALDADDLDASALADKLRSELRDGLTEEDWRQQLHEEGWMLDVVVALSKRGIRPDLDHKYVNALVTHARELRDGTAELKYEYLRDEWGTLLDALSEGERSQFRHQLVSQIVADGQTPLTPLFPIYEAELATAMTCPGVQRNQARLQQALVNLSGKPNPEQRKWLVRLFAKHPALVDEAKKPTKNNLRDRLRAFLEEEHPGPMGADQADGGPDSNGGEQADSTWADAVQKVAKQLGVSLPRKPKKDEDPNGSQEGDE